MVYIGIDAEVYYGVNTVDPLHNEAHQAVPSSKCPPQDPAMLHTPPPTVS